MYISEIIEARRLPRREVTQTPAFKAWFVGSKVVDGRGRPLAVYHGTHNDFDVFSPEYSEILAFFSTSPKFSSGYAMSFKDSPGLVIPVYLRIVHPFDYRENPDAVARDFWHDTGGIEERYTCEQIRTALHGDPNIEDADNPLIHDAPLSFEEFATALRRGDYPAFEGHEFVSWLRQEGFDGIVMREGGGTTYAIFEPTQVKSALSNSAFDPDDERITH